MGGDGTAQAASHRRGAETTRPGPSLQVRGRLWNPGPTPLVPEPWDPCVTQHSLPRRPLPAPRSPSPWAPDGATQDALSCRGRRWARGSRRACLCPGSCPVKKGQSRQLWGSKAWGGGQPSPTSSSASSKGSTSAWGTAARWLVSSCSLESLTAAQPQAPSGRGVRAPVSLWLCPATTHSAALWPKAWLWAGKGCTRRGGLRPGHSGALGSAHPRVATRTQGPPQPWRPGDPIKWGEARTQMTLARALRPMWSRVKV